MSLKGYHYVSRDEQYKIGEKDTDNFENGFLPTYLPQCVVRVVVVAHFYEGSNFQSNLKVKIRGSITCSLKILAFYIC